MGDPPQSYKSSCAVSNGVVYIFGGQSNYFLSLAATYNTSDSVYNDSFSGHGDYFTLLAPSAVVAGDAIYVTAGSTPSAIFNPRVLRITLLPRGSLSFETGQAEATENGRGFETMDVGLGEFKGYYGSSIDYIEKFDTLVSFGGSTSPGLSKTNDLFVLKNVTKDAKSQKNSQKKWENLTDIASGSHPPPRSLHASFVLNQTLYILWDPFPGVESNSTGVYSLNFETLTWTFIASDPPSIQNKLFKAFTAKIAGSERVFLVSDEVAVYTYDGFILAHFSAASETIPEPRSGSCTAAFGANILYFGGRLPSGRLSNELWAYRAAETKWFHFKSTSGVMPSRRQLAGCGLHRTNLYVYGGIDEQNTILNDLWTVPVRFSATGGFVNWTEVVSVGPDFPPPKYGHVMEQVGDVILVTGGVICQENTVYTLNPSNPLGRIWRSHDVEGLKCAFLPVSSVTQINKTLLVLVYGGIDDYMAANHCLVGFRAILDAASNEVRLEHGQIDLTNTSLGHAFSPFFLVNSNVVYIGSGVSSLTDRLLDEFYFLKIGRDSVQSQFFTIFFNLFYF